MRSTTKGDAELRPPADSDAEESATLSPTMEEDDDDDKEADDVNVEEAKVESAAVWSTTSTKAATSEANTAKWVKLLSKVWVGTGLEDNDDDDEDRRFVASTFRTRDSSRSNNFNGFFSSSHLRKNFSQIKSRTRRSWRPAAEEGGSFSGPAPSSTSPLAGEMISAKGFRENLFGSMVCVRLGGGCEENEIKFQ